jgi:hypothetical protein
MTFASGTTAQAFSVSVIQDDLDEHDETVDLVLSNPSEARLGDGSSAVLTILDDDPPPEVAFGQGAYRVGEADGGVTLTVALTPTSGLTITVDYETVGGTASPGYDYIPISGTLVFSPGTTLHALEIAVKDDEAEEGEESVWATLSNPQNATLGANNPVKVTLTERYPVYLPLVIR